MDQLITFTSNNAFLVSALIAAALAVLFNELRLKNQGLFSLTPPDAIRLINQGAMIMDLREHSSFASGHIVDSRNTTKDELISESGDRFKGKKAVLLICDSGSQSGQCAAALRKSGIENVFSLKGGITAWRQENLPVVNNAKGA